MRARFYDNGTTRIYFYEAVVQVLLLFCYSPHCVLIIAYLLASCLLSQKIHPRSAKVML
jgi:hypothetical protein